MKRTMVVMALVLGAFLSSASAYTAPTDEQIQGAAAKPETLGALIQGASSSEAASVVLKVVAAVEAMNIPIEEKKQKVATLLSQMEPALGDQAASAMSIVLVGIPPTLLPAVGTISGPIAPLSRPIALPLAPPVAPKYEGQ